MPKLTNLKSPPFDVFTAVRLLELLKYVELSVMNETDFPRHAFYCWADLKGETVELNACLLYKWQKSTSILLRNEILWQAWQGWMKEWK